MSISHWGLFPGWWEPVPDVDGLFQFGGPAQWHPADFDTFLQVLAVARSRVTSGA